MAVSTVAIWAVRPGRAADSLATSGKAKAIHERLGGKVRLRQTVYGGPNSQQFAYSIEHANMTAFAAFSDKLQADAGWQARVVEFSTADPSAALVSHSVTTDVAGC